MIRILTCLAVPALLFTGVSAAEPPAPPHEAEAKLVLAVTPAADGKDLPVHGAIELPETLAALGAEQIRVEMCPVTASGTCLPGQVVKSGDGYDLWWVLPEAKAGEPQQWQARLLPGRWAMEESFAWKDTPGDHLDLSFGGRTVLRHMYAYDPSTPERLQETYKPYTLVFDAEGKSPITKGPGGLYTHHRGIFIGWNKLAYDQGKTNDWWHMKGVSMVHQKFLEMQAGPILARFTALVHWNDAEGKPVVVERRTLTALRQPKPTIALVDFRSELTAERSDITLGGDPEHAGVHFRPANEVDKKATKYVFPKEGIDVRAEVDLPWAAEQFKIGDAVYGVEEMNLPSNPKGTKYSAYRDYGRIGAFFVKDLAKGKTLPVRYVFWIVAGELPAPEQLAERYDAFARPPEVKQP